ncbi:MAG TPA: T9SS type A sorting domain-containing protein [Caldithrix abyssi]|uniref:T9SS type A sorting domain-containing protein n=1 Tax=Caldithrix abyssi TaxID=187145 RepID=A0A7V4UF03_CALAY|nr:T9SS type A sorting domain-containing protein [Caldithrix abyssi]
MKKLIIYGFIFIIFLFAALPLDGYGQDSTYTNPVGNISGIGDPFVLKHDGQYYMYCTSEASRGFKVWQSDDLVNWVEKGLAFDNGHPGNGWGTGDFWAPEVIFYDGVFYMTYSARAADGKLKICLAKSPYPLGPFINIKTPLLDSALTCIDGNFLIDDDGTPYLYYSKDCSDNIVNGNNVSQIYVQEMTPHSLEPTGDPVFCIQPSQPWEHPQDSWQWNEGPFALKHNGKYYLMYSANYYASADYAIGYATSSTPFGPWEKFSGNPVLAKDLSIGVSGPGHNSVTTSPDDSEMFVVYHTHTDPNAPSGDRQPNIDRMYFSGDTLKIIGPTRSPQPMPSSDGTSLIDAKKKIVNKFRLWQNYPNPFNPVTVIRYEIPLADYVRLILYDTTGRKLRTLVSRKQKAGLHSVIFNGSDLSAGIYLYRLQSGRYSEARKLILLK